MNFRTLILAAAIDRGTFTLHLSRRHRNCGTRCLHARFRGEHGGAGIQRARIQIEISRQSEPGSAIADYYSGHEFTFYLQAHDPKTGVTLARATCTADARGTQVALTAAPPDGSEATLAAR